MWVCRCVLICINVHAMQAHVCHVGTHARVCIYADAGGQRWGLFHRNCPPFAFFLRQRLSLA